MIRQILFFSLLIGVITSANAGTIVEIQSKNKTTTIMTNGKLAKMSMGGNDFVVVDYKSQSVKAVDTGSKRVMVMNIDDLPAAKESVSIKTAIQEDGPGPEIAGYATRKYNYTVNGKQCAIIYGSNEAYKAPGVKELFNAVHTMMKRQRAMMGGYIQMVDPCTLGDMEIPEHVDKIGVPMRTVERGEIDSEIISVKLNAELPAGAFDIPTDYKQVSVQDEMRKQTDNMAKYQQQMQKMKPQVEQMIKQMQQSGQMPPEAMERLRRSQEMLNNMPAGMPPGAPPAQ